MHLQSFFSALDLALCEGQLAFWLSDHIFIHIGYSYSPDRASSASHYWSTLLNEVSLLRMLSDAVTVYSDLPVPILEYAVNNIWLYAAQIELQQYMISGQKAHVDRAVSFYRKALGDKSCSIHTRLSAAVAWAGIRMADYRQHRQATDGYKAALLLIGHAYNPQEEIATVQGLTTDGFACALEFDQLHAAVEIMDLGRSIMWSRDTELHPFVELKRLRQTDPSIASQFEECLSLMRPLAQDVLGTTSIVSRPIRRSNEWELLQRKREDLSSRIRALPGFQNFLWPPGFDDLKDLIDDGYIVMLKCSLFGCEALVVHATGTFSRIGLPNMTLHLATEMTDKMKTMLKLSGRTARGDSEHLSRLKPVQSSRVNQRDRASVVLGEVITQLWRTVVEPIIQHLNLEAQPEVIPSFV